MTPADKQKGFGWLLTSFKAICGGAAASVLLTLGTEPGDRLSTAEKGMALGTGLAAAGIGCTSRRYPGTAMALTATTAAILLPIGCARNDAVGNQNKWRPKTEAVSPQP